MRIKKSGLNKTQPNGKTAVELCYINQLILIIKRHDYTRILAYILLQIFTYTILQFFSQTLWHKVLYYEILNQILCCRLLQINCTVTIITQHVQSVPNFSAFFKHLLNKNQCKCRALTTHLFYSISQHFFTTKYLTFNLSIFGREICYKMYFLKQ